MFLCLIIALLMLVENNQLVIDGARYGLMLWYHDVLPLLLPFMILSNLFVLRLRKQKSPGKYAIAVLFLLGLLCGYPLGAKIAADFTKENILDKRLATLLLPICNNVSPMFLSGYICHIVLADRCSFVFILAMLYIPYILITAASLLLCHHHFTIYPQSDVKHVQSQAVTADSVLLQSIIQITYVGLYIMLCSILVYLIKGIPKLPVHAGTIFCGILEVTQGTKAIAMTSFLPEIKTALILACTSFGGISAILQTKQVLQKSGLSLTYYIVIKLLSACTTGYLTYLLLV